MSPGRQHGTPFRGPGAAHPSGLQLPGPPCEVHALGAQLFGLSTQPTAYQQEMAQPLHLPYEVLSDAEFRLTEALGVADVRGRRDEAPQAPIAADSCWAH